MPVDHAALRAAVHAMMHRGPDDVGYAGLDAGGSMRLTRDVASLEGSSLLLGHRRLSIIDLSKAGWQPMSTPDGRYTLVYNGEIYNYLELGRELEQRGVRFHGHSDTEVLLAALATWGVEALPRLVGMFALALVDVRERRILLARDFFGIKPLYIAHREGWFGFASEPKALLALPHVRRLVSADRLYAYLRSGLTDVSDATLFADIRQIEPGHYLEMQLEGEQVPCPRRYWRVDLARRASLSFADAAEELRTLFLDSVRLHLRSDVPVGAALSGGIDSSAIVAAMRHVEPHLEIHAFSFIPDDAAISEERWVDLAARSSGVIRHVVSPSADELVRDLDALIETQDEPFGSTSIYAQSRVFRLAREKGIKVMLDGQGADEMLAGYPYFMSGRLGTLVRRGRLLEARRFYGRARALPNMSRRALIANTGDALFPEGLRPVARSLLRRRRAVSDDWLDERWFLERGVTGVALPRMRSPSLLHEQLAYSLEFGLPSLLRYEDRNSMAQSIESRVPFLTTTLADLLFSLPDEYIISREGLSKSVFREAMRGIVPDEILNRRDKIGFQTPEQSWLATLSPWVDEVLDSESASSVPALRPGRVRTAWQRIAGGQQPFDRRVWRWINFIRWAELNRVVYE